MARRGAFLWLYEVPGYILNILITSGLSVQGVRRILVVLTSGGDYSHGSLALSIAFTAATGTTASIFVYLLHAAWAGRLTPAQHADWKLFQAACMIPAINVVGCLSIPGFLMAKHWVAYLVMLMLSVNILFQLPPAHLVMHWLIKMPILG